MDEPFGAPVGRIGDPLPEGLTNAFATIADRSVADMARSDRVIPRQVGTGVMRGTQRIQNTDGSYITIGVIPDTDNEFGIAYFAADGDLIFKQLGLTSYLYDPTTGKNVMQIGQLPDDSYGWAVATTDHDVADGF